MTQYATDVVGGTVVASRLVRLACARHLRDLQEAEARALVWNPHEAQEAIDFFATCLVLPEETDDEDTDEEEGPKEATPFVLTPFQAFIVGSLFGWFKWRVGKLTGARKLRQRYRIAYFEGGKGCGKTPMGAGILIYMLVRRRNAQLFCAAVTKEQARIAFADCAKMVKAAPHLAEVIDQKVANLAILDTGSFIRPISSEKRGLDGKRVQGAVIDELHEHPSAVVVAKVRAGIKGRPDALIFIPTNSGFDRESVCWEYHEYSRQVLEGTIENDQWFAFVCHLDSCDACYAAGKTQPSDDCAACDDWKTEGPHWLKANPNLGVSLPWEYLREQVREGVNIPSQRNIVRRLNFCQWTEQRDAWITAELWSGCRSSVPMTLESMRGRECYIGLDLSDKIDLSSAVFGFPREMERAERTEAVLGADAAGAAPIDRAVDVIPKFWMPQKSIVKRSQDDGVPYTEWAKAGHIIATTGELVDHDAIVDFIIAAAKVVHIRGIGVDQAGATAVITRLQREFGDEMVIEVPQGFRHMSEPSKTLEALVVTRNLAHDGSPVMAMCVSNMGKEENTWREIRPVKLHQRKRIDGGVATIDMIKTMQVTPQEQPFTGVVRNLADFL